MALNMGKREDEVDPRFMLTNQQILEKAIQKAIEGGWREEESPSFEYLGEFRHNPIRLNTYVEDIDDGFGGFGRRDYSVEQTIFNHDFAKALWGERIIGYRVHPARDYDRSKAVVVESDYIYMWQSHLQQMVIAEDPIKYLGEHM
jgi:hypothetical protein